MNHAINYALTSLAVAALVGLAACATTTPEQVNELERARLAVQTLEGEPMAPTVAAKRLSNAREALARADVAHENGEPLELIQHEANVARTNAEIGMEEIEEAEALARIDRAELERQQVLLEARTTEAERAEARARRQMEEVRQSRQAAEASRAVAEQATGEAERLERELSELQAEQTERGLVLTLSDVLFATDAAELKPGSEVAIDRLAEFLQDHPERKLLIEGHTDSRGSDAYNERLSNARADSVAEELVDRGISSTRLRPVGMGEAYPVAPNETTAGRQQNRRVEIVVSDRDGTFPPAARRTASSATGR